MMNQRFYLSRRRERGVTLIEVLVVMALIGIIMLIAMPNLRRSRIRAELISQMKLVRQGAAVARINAIKSGSQTVLTTATVNTRPGLVAWVDTNANTAQDNNELELGRWMFRDHTTVTADNSLASVSGGKRGVIFLPNGLTTASTSGTFGLFFVSDHLGNAFEITVRNGTGTVEERMRDFSDAYQPEPFKYWRY